MVQRSARPVRIEASRLVDGAQRASRPDQLPAMRSSKQGACPMTLEELGEILDGLAANETVRIHHDLFRDLFPPGESDDNGRAACLEFAQHHNCRIDNKPDDSSGEGELWFVKNADRT